MARFHLYWVRTRQQWDDGFVVARTSRAAACYVRDENFVFDTAWAEAERLSTLPDHMQAPAAAVSSTSEDPRHVHWASPEVLSACGITIVHAASPRVFLWHDRLFTEGLLDYVRRQEVVSASDTDPVFDSMSTPGVDHIVGRA